MTWLVLGASPLAEVAYAYARQYKLVDKVITTNSGIFIEPAPDVYFLSDSFACNKYSELARVAQRDYGTHCVTMLRDIKAMKQRNVDWFDEFIDVLPSHGCTYETFQLSALFALEYACKNGATGLLLCVMDGYDHTEGAVNYHGKCENAPVHHKETTATIIIPKMRALLPKYPHIHFLFIGQPLYKDWLREWDNWSIECPITEESLR